ncbi:hypothetical protein [Microtetraspora fusca]|uniref:hypothetical protein n=1 Tax=Microtetraspora fusca TaxID=1997 RepID=UPI000AC6C4DD|nr:hypothetical protein [Microtetraspora fusca]
MPATPLHISQGTPMGAAVTAMRDATNGHRPPWLALVTSLAWAAGASVAAARLFRWE